MKIVRVPKGSRRQVRTLQPKLPSAQDVLVLAALSGKTGHIFSTTQRVTDWNGRRHNRTPPALKLLRHRASYLG